VKRCEHADQGIAAAERGPGWRARAAEQKKKLHAKVNCMNLGDLSRHKSLIK
jgi:hypothetical protein